MLHQRFSVLRGFQIKRTASSRLLYAKARATHLPGTLVGGMRWRTVCVRLPEWRCRSLPNPRRRRTGFVCRPCNKQFGKIFFLQYIHIYIVQWNNITTVQTTIKIACVLNINYSKISYFQFKVEYCSYIVPTVQRLENMAPTAHTVQLKHQAYIILYIQGVHLILCFFQEF